MAKPSPLTYLPILEDALKEEIGLLVMTNDPKNLKARLYEARKLADNPALAELIIFHPASNDRLLVARKSVELEP